MAGIFKSYDVRGIVPEELENPYNNSVWFLAQSKYVAWVFVAEALQRLHRRLSAKGYASRRFGAAIAIGAAGLAVPSAVQHFVKEFSRGTTVYEREAVAAAGFIARHSRPGDVVLAGRELLDPVLTLTKCRVPIAYFQSYLAPATDVRRRRAASTEFWAGWARGEVRTDLLRELAVDYVAAPKTRSSGLLPAIALVYENSEYAVFRVKRNP